MSWRDLQADQNLRLAAELLEKQSQLNRLTEENEDLRRKNEVLRRELSQCLKDDLIKEKD